MFRSKLGLLEGLLEGSECGCRGRGRGPGTED
jgi:hypothetical protein